MIWTEFVLRLILAFILGAGIGIERQWMKTRAVLKTNVLVSLGAAMFVMMAAMTPNDTSPTRVSAQVVSGIGFLGAGVILREGRSVRGINTAATLWCAGAIGSLCGSGFFIPAYFGTLAVIGANLMLRPVVQIFHPQVKTNSTISPEQSQEAVSIKSYVSPGDRTKTSYRFCLECQPEAEGGTLGLLVRLMKEQNLDLAKVQNRNKDDPDGTKVEIVVEFSSKNQELKLLEQLINSFKDNPKVYLTHWEIIANTQNIK